jgi:hypothetical protein
MSIESQEAIIESTFLVDAAGSNKAAVSATGALSVISTQAGTTATITQVSVGTASTLLLAANPNRKSVVLCNQGVVTALYIAFATTCSAVSFTYKTVTGPYIFPVVLGYTGAISAIQVGGAVLVNVTEIV